MRPDTNKELENILQNKKPTLFQRIKGYLTYENKNFWYCAYCGKFHSKRIAAHNVYGDPLRGEEFNRLFNVCSKGLTFVVMMEGRINRDPI